VLMQRMHDRIDVQAGHKRWERGHVFLSHSLGITLRLRAGYSWLKPSNHAEIPTARPVIRHQAQRYPQLAVVQLTGIERELEIAWHHADNFVRLAVEQNFCSQHISVAVQPVLPRGITDDRDLLFLFILLL